MKEKIKTAAYVRVSANSGQALHSAKAQTEHYQKLIEANPAWEFAGIYVDQGISGMTTRNRAAFAQMMDACQKGKIDRILVKSVSRFARNTLDLLQSVRMLKEKGISVWFETQQIDSMTEEGELMLSLLASLAQAESESISENAKWAIRKKFQMGIGNTRCRTFGYQWIDGNLTVIPKEAEAVREIFTSYLAGKTYREISESLTEKGICSIHGNRISHSALRFILQNPVYTGTMVLQKTFLRDPISKKKVINTGQLPRYVVEQHHEAIVSREVFERVQGRMEERRRRQNPVRIKNESP